MPTYRYKSWAGQRRSIEADHISFEPGHVVFWRDRPDALIGRDILLAVDNADVHDLHPDTEPDPSWWK